MARVIKAGAGQKPARAPARVIVDSGGKKVIEREVYQAKQDAEHILRRAEEQRQQLLAEGKRRAAQAREEAMARGASEAFATAASEALVAFRLRAERYAQAADDIRAVALEVVRKVLGTEPDVGADDIERVMHKGLAQLRARRRLRLQVGARRLAELADERPNLMRALQNEPDLVIEGVSDVGVGFARVVTEVGGALCAEATALDALSSAVNVHEQPRPRPQRSSSEETQVGTGPEGIDALRETLRPAAARRTAVTGRRGAPMASSVSMRAEPSVSASAESNPFEYNGSADDGQETVRGTRSRIRFSERNDEGPDLRAAGRVQRPRIRVGEQSTAVPAASSGAPRMSSRVMPIGDTGGDAAPPPAPPSAPPSRARRLADRSLDDGGYIEEFDEIDDDDVTAAASAGSSARARGHNVTGDDELKLYSDDGARLRKKP